MSRGPQKKKLERDFHEERQATRQADLAWAMEAPQGRRLLFELLYDPTTGLGFEAAIVTSDGALAAGAAAKRAAAKYWVERMRRETPEEFLEMHREQLEARDESRNLRETAEETPTSDEE